MICISNEGTRTRNRHRWNNLISIWYCKIIKIQVNWNYKRSNNEVSETYSHLPVHVFFGNFLSYAGFTYGVNILLINRPMLQVEAKVDCMRLIMSTLQTVSYVYWTVHHLDIWIKIDQLMSFALFFAQHVSNASTFIFRSLRLRVSILLWFDVCWRYGA